MISCRGIAAPLIGCALVAALVLGVLPLEPPADSREASEKRGEVPTPWQASQGPSFASVENDTFVSTSWLFPTAVLESDAFGMMLRDRHVLMEDMLRLTPLNRLQMLGSSSVQAQKLASQYPYERMQLIKDTVQALSYDEWTEAIRALQFAGSNDLLVDVLTASVVGSPAKLSANILLDNLKTYSNDEAVVDILRDRVLSEWVRQDRSAAAAWALQQYPYGDMHHTVAGVVAEAMLEVAPAEALEWALRHLPESTLSQGAAALLGRWMDQDAYSASRWIERLDMSPKYDIAFQVYAQKTALYDWDASQWALTRIVGVDARNNTADFMAMVRSSR